jgi:hypothetical protein
LKSSCPARRTSFQFTAAGNDPTINSVPCSDLA